jgi:Rrf2 family transcriptional regulator, iron-sulfur cluster assembly transcription factor
MREKAKKLPAKAILKVMGEDEMLEKCVLGLKKCTEKQPCPMHAQYKIIKQQLIGLFVTTSIQELATQMQEGDLFINNNWRKSTCL